MSKAGRKKAQRIQQSRTTGIAIVIAIGTFIALFAIPPEEVRVRSADNRFSIEGQARSEAKLSILEKDEIAQPSTALFGSIYEVEVNGEVSEIPFELRMDFPDQILPRTDYLLYRYSPQFKAWESLPTTLQVRDRQAISFVSLRESTLFALGIPPDILHTLDSTLEIDTLLRRAPKETIGYRIFSAIEHYGAEDRIVEQSGIEFGGCAGDYKMGESQKRDSIEKRLEKGIRSIEIIWELGEGCAKEEVLESLQ